MINDEVVKKEWENIDNSDIGIVCDLLKKHERRIPDYLADCVASICDVDKTKMMIEQKNANTTHARWLFWYAYRYMSHDAFIQIKEITKRYGKEYTEQSIALSVNKMRDMIANETIWTKRWLLIKRIIKLRDVDNTQANTNNNADVVVTYPKHIKVKLNIIND